MHNELINLANKIISTASKKNIIISTAESCTGGLVISSLTEISGSSKVIDCGFITYTHSSKVNLLNVKQKTLDKYGAVSEQTVKEMAIGAINNSNANLSVSVSGIAGPTGGNKEKPVGLVYWAIAYKNNIKSYSHTFKGDRNSIRLKTVKEILDLILSNIE